MLRFFCIGGLSTGAALLCMTPGLAQLNAPSIDSPPSTAQAAPGPATNPDISFRRPLRVTNVLARSHYELRRAEHTFTIDFPADAVEPLQKLVVEQVEGPGYSRYSDSGSRAFDGESRESLSLSSVESDRNQRTITVEFDPPVEPGRQVTVVLNARNPRAGIYTYQFTAFPVGAQEGQYAGVERLNIYEPIRRRDRFRWR